MRKNLLLVFGIALLMMVISVPAFAQDETLPYTVNVGGNEALGDFLVGPNGMTLYLFKRDGLGVSNCVDGCAQNWPPLLVESADAATGEEGLAGEVGTIERADGTLQVTYNDIPLYYWVNDAAVGDATGQGVGQVWEVINPLATVYIGGNADLGAFLVAGNGMTLYLFTRDEAGVSNCEGDCLAAWPALLVDSAEDVVPGVNLPGTLGTIERTDGTLQVTYNDMPLYFWVDDLARGDATGENVGEVWFVIAPETVTLSNSAELGDFLVAPNGMTLYTFTNDEAGVSNCVEQCADNWPPLGALPANRLVAGAGIEGELGTIERPNGRLQVTYNGMPLYFWVNDAAPGDTTGQGADDVWFVAAP